MSYAIYHFGDDGNCKIIDRCGCFDVVEYQRDMSVTPEDAMQAYFCGEMNVRRRQLVCRLAQANGNIVVQAGAMQWMAGYVSAVTGIKGIGDLIGKTFRGAVTKESIIKPEYSGDGLLVLEPTYKHLILLDVDSWNGGIVLDDGLFMACESSLQQKIVARSNISSAVAGKEGFFNLGLHGVGKLCIESPVPYSELICVDLLNDVLKIDGNFAIAWSESLQFTVERAGKTLIGSAASGEGLVNVYRGTGRVLLAPVSGIGMQ